MTRTTELIPLLISLNLDALAAKSNWITPHSWRSSSATRSIVNRLAHRRIELRLHNAGFKETCYWKTSIGRIVSNQMLLNFSPTRSPSGSSHEIRDSWSASSAKPAATHRRT